MTIADASVARVAAVRPPERLVGLVRREIDDVGEIAASRRIGVSRLLIVQASRGLMMLPSHIELLEFAFQGRE